MSNKKTAAKSAAQTWMRRPGDHAQKRVPSRSVPVSQAISTRSFEPLDTASRSAPTMTIAVRSKGGSGGSSASAAGSGSGAGLFITAGDLLRTFFGIFAAEAHAARCHTCRFTAQPASTPPQLSQKNVAVVTATT